jgi:sporulation protein YlmC with PRC-barrel domain
MNIKNLMVSAFCSLALISVMSVGVQAQDKAAQDKAAQDKAAQDKSAQGKAVQEKVPVAGVVPLGATVIETEAVATGWRASKLMHAEVYNDANQKIGKIDDFIVSPDGKLSMAVLDVGGFLGIGTHRVAIPVEQLGKVAPKVVLKGATKEALKALPEFRYVA